MKLPRVECPCCQRHIAAGIVAGAPSKGRLWRHDPPERPARFGDALVSCDGSLDIVDLPAYGTQLEFTEPEDPAGGEQPESTDTMSLF
ncbi:hypothetical protein OG234_13265 [Streptomyces sp. NBC_01420]